MRVGKEREMRVFKRVEREIRKREPDQESQRRELDKIIVLI